MTKRDLSARRRRGWIGLVLAVLSLALLPAVAGARQSPSRAGAAAPKPFFDSRDASLQAAARAGSAPASARTTAAQARLRTALGRQGVLAVDPLTGTPRQLVRLDGALSGPSAGAPAAIALRYVRAHATALGLDAGDLAGLGPAVSATTARGLTVVRWTQRDHGIPAFDNGLRAAVDRAGRVVMVGGSPLPDLAVRGTTPKLSASAALRAVGRDAGAPATARVTAAASGARRATRFADGSRADLVLFGGRGGARLAWAVRHRVSVAADYLELVDAATGRILYRANLTKGAEQAQIYPIYPGRPGAVNALQTVDLQGLGYLPANANRLAGKFAHTYNDTDGSLDPQSSEEVHPSAGHDFLYPFQTSGGGHNFEVASHGCDAQHLCSWNSNFPRSWQFNANNDAVQVHWFLGHFHDHLAASPIDFTDAWGNFEVGGTGGNDPVSANANEGAGTGSDGGPTDDFINNAFMDTQPDGQSPTMGMFLNKHVSDFPERENNNGDDGVTVYHEYTHGLSNRLITDDDGFGALNSAQAGAMGEAWSDWYAFDLASRDGHIPDTNAPGEMDLGVYSDPEPHLVRSQALDCPVGTTNPICPGAGEAGAGGYTYGDTGKIACFPDCFPEVHADGEIWGETLWDLRVKLQDSLGSESAASNVAETLVTDGMRLSPDEPSFLDERNAIIAADQADYAGAHVDLIWSVFAHRGMGFFATSVGGNDTAPHEDFTVPPSAAGPKGTVRGTVTDTVSGLPVGGVQVTFGDPALGFPPFRSGATQNNGAYIIGSVPALTYPRLAFNRTGLVPSTVTGVPVTGGGVTVRDATVSRNWAFGPGGGSATSTDESGADFGCGSAELIDGDQGTGWSPSNDDNPGTGPAATLRLPATIDVSRVYVDPTGTCGDDPSSSTGKYRLETSADGITFHTAATGTFGAANRSKLNPITPGGSTGRGIRYVRFTPLTAQDESCTDDCSGPLFVDVSEIEVVGGPRNQLPRGSLSATPQQVDAQDPVTLDASSFTDPDSRITGYQWDLDGNGTFDRTTSTPTTVASYANDGAKHPTVHVTDFRGGFGTASATVQVGRAPVLPRYGHLAKRGHKGAYAFKVKCAQTCRVKARLVVSKRAAKRLGLKKRTVGRLSRRITTHRARTLKVKLTHKTIRKLKRHHRKTLKATFRVNTKYAGGRHRAAHKVVRIRR